MDQHNDQDQASSRQIPEAEPEPIPEAPQADDVEAPAPEPAPIIPEVIFPEDEPPAPQTPQADFSTVGTGSVFAISCSLLTVLIIFICIAIFIVTRLF